MSPGAPAMHESASTWTVAFRGTFSSVPLDVEWVDGRDYGAWTAAFNGYGTTKVVMRDGRRVLLERPKASTSSGETHASLVTTQARYQDIDLSAAIRTVRQLRTGSDANPWEVAWLIWNYSDNQRFYYLALKPNGWELGKEDPAYPGAQRFLATGSTTYPVGDWHQVRVRQVGNTITCWANGKRLVDFTDSELPYRSGKVALYNEDAEALFRDIIVRVPTA